MTLAGPQLPEQQYLSSRIDSGRRVVYIVSEPHPNRKKNPQKPPLALSGTLPRTRRTSPVFPSHTIRIHVPRESPNQLHPSTHISQSVGRRVPPTHFPFPSSRTEGLSDDAISWTRTYTLPRTSTFTFLTQRSLFLSLPFFLPFSLPSPPPSPVYIQTPVPPSPPKMPKVEKCKRDSKKTAVTRVRRKKEGAIYST